MQARRYPTSPFKMPNAVAHKIPLTGNAMTITRTPKRCKPASRAASSSAYVVFFMHRPPFDENAKAKISSEPHILLGLQAMIKS